MPESVAVQGVFLLNVGHPERRGVMEPPALYHLPAFPAGEGKQAP